MTTKHFILLADAFREIRPLEMADLPSGISPEQKAEAFGELSAWSKAVQACASFCEAQNSRFNRELWFDYVYGLCGPSGEKVES